MEEDETLSFIDNDVSFTENIAEIVGFLLLGKFLAVFWYNAITTKEHSIDITVLLTRGLPDLKP